MELKQRLRAIVSHFAPGATLRSAERYGCGHINDTYCVTVVDQTKEQHLVLQRINHQIFQQPERVMENIEAVTGHLRHKVMADGGDPARETLTLIPTEERRSLYHADDDSYWRCYGYIPDTVVYQVVENTKLAYEAAKAFGMFQCLLHDFPVHTLHETIVGFHDTGQRFQTFVRAVESDVHNRAREAAAEIAFLEERAGDTTVLTDLLARDRLPVRVTHNDTKLNNVLFDAHTGEGICVVDLDTVMPGLSLYDYGDLIRCGANPAAEDEQDLRKVELDLGLYDAFTRGYLATAGQSLTPLELRYLPFSAKLIALELGMRFLTDHLCGDQYFRIHRAGHNLDRARTQLHLAGDIEQKLEQMSAIVRKHSEIAV